MMPRLRLVLTRQHHARPVSTTRSLQQAPRRVWVMQATLLTRLRLVLKQQQRALPRSKTTKPLEAAWRRAQTTNLLMAACRRVPPLRPRLRVARKKKQPCAAAAEAASAGKTKKDDKANDKAAKVKCEVSKDDVNVGDIVHFFA